MAEVKLETDRDREEWLQCLQAAVCLVPDRWKELERVHYDAADMADQLWTRFRKRTGEEL